MLSCAVVSTPRILVAGSINVDLVAHVERLPGRGETVAGGRLERSGGGKGANQAVAAARAGGAVSLVGAVGDDELGDQALDELRDEGIDVSAVLRLRGRADGRRADRGRRRRRQPDRGRLRREPRDRRGDGRAGAGAAERRRRLRARVVRADRRDRAGRRAGGASGRGDARRQPGPGAPASGRPLRRAADPGAERAGGARAGGRGRGRRGGPAAAPDGPPATTRRPRGGGSRS